MIGYAVGETISGGSASRDRSRSSSDKEQQVLTVEEGSLVASPVEKVSDGRGNERETTRNQSMGNCYEVVTAWVHPK